VTLPAIQSKKEIQEIKNEDVIAVFEKDLNIYKALADGDIAKVIKILALLAKYPALVTVVKADIVSAIAKDPLTRTFDQGIEVAEIEKLNAAYLHDPLLTAGINKFFELDNFIHLQQATKISDVEPNNIEVAEAPDHASSKALSELEAFNRKEFQRRSEELSLPDDASKDVDQAKEKKPDSRRYRLISDKMFEWSWSKGFEMLPKSVNQELNMLQQIVNEIRWDAAEFKNPIHKLQAIAFASELQEALFAYVAKTEIKKDNDLTTLKQSFNTARAQVNDLLKHRESNKLNEKIHALFKMIDDMINNTSFSRFLEKKSGYAFYKTKARLLSNIDKVKNPANDPKIPFKKTR
jgi:hypothetical protein